MLNLPPLSLYIHFPWCVKKCPYCDFNSHSLKENIPEKAYVEKLLIDLDQDLLEKSLYEREIISIFMGGGTPSLFSPKYIHLLLIELKKRLKFSKSIEITLEANPGTVEQERFQGYFQAGINRLSIGCQSFDPEHLQRLGRIHSGNEAISAIKAAKLAGFENFNLDLMFGLPQQTVEEGLADLKQAIDLKPTHISWYQLTLEPNTYFANFPPTLPQDEYIEDLHVKGIELLAQNGFHSYEISAYCQAENMSQHNLNYWEFGDYLGIGAGAHGKITLPSKTIVRTIKHKNPKNYLSSENIILEKKVVPQQDIFFEFMLNALRLKKPIDSKIFTSRTFLSLNDLKNKIDKSGVEKFIYLDENNFICKTNLGEKFLNNALCLLLDEPH